MFMFLTDVMLLKLGRWLRILGIRTSVPKAEGDEAILFQALKEHSILLTMDRDLASKAKKAGLPALLIPSTCIDIEEQLKLVHSHYSFKIADKTLCTECGGDLVETDSKNVADKVPKSVPERFDKVWLCKECGHVFWEGSHWKNINKTISKVREWASM